MVAATSSHPRNGSSPWNPTPLDTGLPLVGELILLLANVRRLGFSYGPESAVALTSAPSSVNPASVVPLPNVGPRVVTAAATRTQSKQMTWHMWLVAEMPADGNAVLFPVFSYSRPPKDHPPAQPWDADQWMRHTEEVNRIHHVPIPAAVDGELWEPLPNPHPNAPVVTLGEWKNNTPSWLALSPVRVPFRDPLPKWCRYRTGPLVVDNPEITGLRLSNFALGTLPSWLQSKGYALPPTNSLGIHTVIIPRFDAVWGEIYASDDHNGAFSGDDPFSLYDGSENGAFHEELDALSSHHYCSNFDDNDADGITDPLWIWNLFPLHPGVPKWVTEDLVVDKEEALQRMKEKTATRVREWRSSVRTNVASGGGGGGGHGGAGEINVREDTALFQEVELGESAVP